MVIDMPSAGTALRSFQPTKNSQDLRAQRKTFAGYQLLFGGADEFDQTVGNVAGRIACSQRMQHDRERVGRAAEHGLFVDERQRRRHHTLAGEPAFDVVAVLSQPAELLVQPPRGQPRGGQPGGGGGSVLPTSWLIVIETSEDEL